MKLPILILLLLSQLTMNLEETGGKEANPFNDNMFQVETEKEVHDLPVESNETNLKDEKEVETLSTNKRPEYSDIPLEEEVLDYLYLKSEEYEISYELMLAIADVESDFGRDTYGKNKDGTYDSGLLQVNSSNLKWLSKLAGIKNVDPQNYKHNIDMAVALFDYERQYWRDLEYSEEDVFWLSIYGYHRGRGNTIEMAARDVWSSSYVDKVVAAKEQIERSAK